MTIFLGKKQIFDTTSPMKFSIRSNSTSSNDDASGKCIITFKRFFPILIVAKYYLNILNLVVLKIHLCVFQLSEWLLIINC